MVLLLWPAAKPISSSNSSKSDVSEEAILVRILLVATAADICLRPWAELSKKNHDFLIASVSISKWETQLDINGIVRDEMCSAKRSRLEFLR